MLRACCGWLFGVCRLLRIATCRLFCALSVVCCVLVVRRVVSMVCRECGLLCDVLRVCSLLCGCALLPDVSCSFILTVVCSCFVWVVGRWSLRVARCVSRVACCFGVYCSLLIGG